jgi:hypothetical protein
MWIGSMTVHSSATGKAPPEGPAHIPFRDRLTCSVSDATDATGLSRSMLYIKMKAGEIEWTKVGARRLIKVPSLLRLLDE